MVVSRIKLHHKTCICQASQSVFCIEHSSSDAHHVVLLSLFAVMQAENPKQQYLLLRALNEVITSLTGDATLPDRQQDEVSLHHLLPAHVISLVGLAFTPIYELSLACH